MSNDIAAGLYIHVPFCIRKCPYCDFYSVTDRSLISDWLTAFRQEVSLYEGRFSSFDSLYIGGGTPTLLNGSQVTAVMESLWSTVSLLPDSEITLETNPDDLTQENLALYRQAGVNRVSVGAQSFHDEELRYLRRRHTARQTKQALSMIRAAGFDNVSVDLMYGIPGQTEDSWIKSLECALSFDPEHLSCYQLTIGEGTVFGEMAAQGRMVPLEEEKERRFFLLTSELLTERGYLHYEVSNFARSESYFSRHNRKYWQHVPYLGLGPSAHSFLNSTRWWNTRSVTEYCQRLAQGGSPLAGEETLSEEQYFLEALYLGLRTREGIDKTLATGHDRILDQLQSAGLVRVIEERIIPTREGLLVADSLPLLFTN